MGIGRATFPRRHFSYTISYPTITADSYIEITFDKDPGDAMGQGTVQYIEKLPGVGFTIHLSSTVSDNIPFTYQVINPGDVGYSNTGAVSGDLFIYGDLYVFGTEHVTETEILTGDQRITGSLSVSGDTHICGEMFGCEDVSEPMIYYDTESTGLGDYTVHSALDDLSYLMPSRPNNIGQNIAGIPNSGIPSWSLAGFVSGRFTDNSTSISTSYITQQGNFNVTGIMANADRGILVCVVNSVEVAELNLESIYDSSKRETGQDNYTPSNIGKDVITLTYRLPYWDDYSGWGSPYTNYDEKFPAYQIATYSIPLNLVNGLNDNIQIIHYKDISKTTIYSIDNSYTHLNTIFRDIGPTPPATWTPTISLNTLSSNKYLSGVRFYSTGDTFNMSVNGVNVFANSYKNSPLDLDFTQFDAGTSSITYNNLGAGSAPLPTDGAVHNEVFVIGSTGTLQSDARIKTRFGDPFNEDSYKSSDPGIYLVNTYTNSSTELIEYFRDETYRKSGSSSFDTIPSWTTGDWDSTQNLTTYDSGNGLQFYGSLIYPTINYSSGYLPTQSINYSGLSGNRVFIRLLRDNGTPHTNGIIQLNGISFAQIEEGGGSQVARVEIKLPSQTGWLNLGKIFNIATFTGSDGDGCLTEYTGSNFSWTSATFSTALSGYMIAIRITFFNSSISCSSLQLIIT